MLMFLPAPLRGLIAILLYFINLFLGPGILTITAIIGWITPVPKWRKAINNFLYVYPPLWVDINNFIRRLTTKTEYEVSDLSQLSLDKSYLVICNHQAWSDILILFSVFSRKIPMLKFFIKKQLQWIPPIGIGGRIMDYPFMERHTKEQIQKNPALKGKDAETARRACAKFNLRPTSVINFCEGTRCTPAKQKRQDSPYRYLLKPKIGGVSLVINNMNKNLDKILNVTIIYPRGINSAWNYFNGKMDKIIVRVEALPITDDLKGDYENDPHYRAHIQQYMNKIWHDKDQLIASEYEKFHGQDAAQQVNAVD